VVSLNLAHPVYVICTKKVCSRDDLHDLRTSAVTEENIRICSYLELPCKTDRRGGGNG